MSSAFLGPAHNAAGFDVSSSSALSSMSVRDKQTLFFGPNPHPTRYTGEEEDGFSVSMDVLPRAWAGENERINSVIIKRVTGNDASFMTRRVFPISKIPKGGKLRFQELTFDNGMLDDIPELGTGRLVTHNFREWERTIGRRGLGFHMEDGFLMTDMGIRQYLYHVEQISNAVDDYLTLSAYHECLSANSKQDYYTRFGLRGRRNGSRDDLSKAEIYQWSMISKQKFGIQKILQHGTRILKDHDVAADTLILPAGTREYIRLNRPETTRYDEGGPRALQSVYGSDPNYLWRELKVDLYETSLFPITDSEEPADPLARVRAIGEFGDSLYSDNSLNELNIGSYDTALRDRTIHDNSDDALRTITFRDMIDNSGLFDADGQLSDHIGKVYFRGSRTIKQWYTRCGMFRHLDAALKSKVAKGVSGAAANTQAPKRRVYNDADDDDENGSDEEFGNHRARKSSSRASGRKNLKVRTYSFTDEERATLKSEAEPFFESVKKANGGLAGPKSKDGVSSAAVDLSRVFVKFSGKDFASEITVDDMRAILHALRNDRSTSTESEMNGYPYVKVLKAWLSKESRQVELVTHGHSDALYAILGLLFPNRMPDETIVTSMAKRSEEVTGYPHMYSKLTKHMKSGPSVSGSVKEKALYKQSQYPLVDLVLPGFIVWIFEELWNDKSLGYQNFDNMAKRINAFAESVKRSRQIRKSADSDVIQKSADPDIMDMFEALGNLEKNGISDFMNLFVRNSSPTPKEITGVVEAKNGGGDSNEEDDAQLGGVSTEDANAEITKDVFDRFMANNIPVAIDFAFCRPSMLYEMASAVVLKSGAETGNCYFGQANFMLSNDGNRKMLYGFFTCYAGAILRQSKNVHVIHNVVCRRYLGGGGVEMFNNGNPDDIKSYTDDEGFGEKSIIIIPLIPGERLKGEFDLTGQYHELSGMPNDPKKPHYAMYQVMRSLYEFRRRDCYYDIGYFDEEDLRNTLCYRMTTYIPTIENGALSINTRGKVKWGTGHWGRPIYPGVGADRMGMGENGFINNRCVKWDTPECNP